MSKTDELAAYALEVIKEQIMFTDQRCNGPVCSIVANAFGKQFQGRDDAFYDSGGNGARFEAVGMVNEYKAKLIAEKARELFVGHIEEDEETRL